jgi:hypothetical protein
VPLWLATSSDPKEMVDETSTARPSLATANCSSND